MRAFIYLGGPIWKEHIKRQPEDGDLVVCADGGYKNALNLDVKKIDIFVGDMDSVGVLQPPEGAEQILLPVEKNQTDAQVAIETAYERGARDMVIIGGLGGRMDHALSNLGVLENLKEKGALATMENGQNRVRFLKNDSTLIVRDNSYPYIGLVTLEKQAKGVEIQGCKYPLKKAVIKRQEQFAVSNEIEKNCALIYVKKGSVYIIESADR